MGAVVELLPPTAITDTTFEQPIESVADVSSYMEAFVVWNVMAIDRQGATTTIIVQSAIENRDEQYVNVASYQYTSDPSLPDVRHIYLSGSTTGSSDAPGFGRYLRIRVDQPASGSITISAKAVLKP